MAAPAANIYIDAVLDTTRIALPLHQVERIVRAAALLPVPGAGGCLLGALDLAGRLIAVYAMRQLVGLPHRPLRASDYIVIASDPADCALLVDDVLGTVEAGATDRAASFPMHAAGVRGVARTGTGMLLVHDLRRLLALQRAIPIANHV